VKIILRADVRDLGRAGELVEVRPGYARNFLLPRELAVPATRANVRDWQKRIDAARTREQQERAVAVARADQLRGEHLFVARAPAEGTTRLHGSVTALDVADALRDQLQVEVDRRDVELGNSIRALGDYGARVKVYRGLTVGVTVHVLPTIPSAEEQAAIRRGPVVEEPEEEVVEAETAPEAADAETAAAVDTTPDAETVAPADAPEPPAEE